ncbi:MAG: FAD-dependent monooxygenase [Candidatus Korobacteraceae bacterium]
MDLVNDAAKWTQGENLQPPSQWVPVLIIGAGPTGLLLAAELQRRGVQCHLIDAQPGL